MNEQNAPWAEFWKFRGVDEGLYRLLINRELWFSTPDKFNDPFDCQVDVENTYAAIRGSLRPHLDSRFTEIIASVESHARSSRYAYLCVCKAWHQTLMWSHYANNHKGVSLGFSFGSDSPFKMREMSYGDVTYDSKALSNEISRVNESFGMMTAYPSSYPGISMEESDRFFEYFQHGLGKLYDVVKFMKAECWRYEEEFRFEIELPEGKTNGASRLFSPSDLKHVIFGTRCEATHEVTVRKLLSSEEWGHVQFWRCERDSVRLVLSANKIE